MTDKLIKLGELKADYSKISQSDIDKITELFGFKNGSATVVVQQPGEVSLLRTDDLTYLNPEFSTTVMKVIIYLQDWERGQFSSYDDYIHTNWKAGEVMTYNWHRIEHCSANASNKTHKTLELTGVVTEKTTEFINRLKRFGSHQLQLTDNSWF